MKTILKIIGISIVFGLSCLSSFADGDDPRILPLNPIDQHGSGSNNGGSKSPETDCPLTVYYSQTLNQIEFVNSDSQSVSFVYFILDEDEYVLMQGNQGIVANGNYILDLSNLSKAPFIIQIEIDDIVYEGYINLE